MAFDSSCLLVDDVEARRHRFVVRDTFRIIALHETDQYVRKRNALLFYHFVIADNVQNHVRCDQGNAADFIFVEEFIGNLNHPFHAELVAWQVVGNRNRIMLHLVQFQQRSHFEELRRRDMIDDCSVLNSCHQQFFIVF